MVKKIIASQNFFRGVVMCGAICFATSVKAEDTSNGLRTNKLASNRLSANKLSANGLSANRLSANKISANRLSANRLSANKIATNRLGVNRIAMNSVNANGNITTENNGSSFGLSVQNAKAHEGKLVVSK